MQGDDHLCFVFITGRTELLRRAAWRRRQAFRPGTRANIRSHVLLFTAFAREFGARDFPASTSTLLAFAEFLLVSFTAEKSVLNALASVRHFHLDCGLPTEAFDDRALLLWRRALPLTFRSQRAQAQALPLELLRQLCQLSRLLGVKGEVLATLMAVLFASMARLSSLLPHTRGAFDVSRHPTCRDVIDRGGLCLLRIKWAKAHQHTEQGFWVPLMRRQDTDVCPVVALERLRALRGSTGLAGGPLFFLPCEKGAHGGSGAPLTMPVARAWLAVLLAGMGRHPREFSFHSFRRGACTLAFANGASEGDIMQLGGWRSSAVRAYFPALDARKRAAVKLSTN